MIVGRSLNRDLLINDIDAAINNWDERSQFSIAGVKNLSISDLDELRLYAKEYNGFNLMEPMGSIKEVLVKYDII